MDHFFSIDSIVSLVALTMLEIILGIDNVIFVSILIGRLQGPLQLKARRMWMISGILVRTILLFTIGWIVANASRPVVTVFGYGFNLRNLIMIAGGLFLLYKTAVEIHERLEGEPEGGSAIQTNRVGAASFGRLIGQIILVDMVFSFDSIITAIGLARSVPIMIIAVIIAMTIMFFFVQKISGFIEKHPTLKMLALSFLLMIGFSLFFEGLEPVHHSHIDKGYIYFAMAFSFGVEMMNLWMKKRSARKRQNL